MSQPNKRLRPAQGFHIDSIDCEDTVSYEDIHVREGRLNKIGVNTVREPLPVRIPLENNAGDSSAWMKLTAWTVTDDTDLALDPHDGRLYEEALERDVMEDDVTDRDGRVQAAKKQYIRSKVSVSLLSKHCYE